MRQTIAKPHDDEDDDRGADRAVQIVQAILQRVAPVVGDDQAVREQVRTRTAVIQCSARAVKLYAGGALPSIVRASRPLEGEASFPSIHSICSASTSQQAATCSNALFMDKFLASAARCLASSALCRYMSARDDI